MDTEKIILKRNVRAFLIPSGDKVTLQKGEPVSITQALGGSYTVMLNGNLFKLDGEDADAIGKKTIQTIINPSDIQNKNVTLTHMDAKSSGKRYCLLRIRSRFRICV